MLVNEFEHVFSKRIQNHCEGSNQLVNNKVRKNVYTDRVFSCLISHLAVECYAFLHESVFYASGKTWRQTSLYLQWGEIVSLSILFHYIFSHEHTIHITYILVIKCKICNYLYPNLAFLDKVILYLVIVTARVKFFCYKSNLIFGVPMKSTVQIKLFTLYSQIDVYTRLFGSIEYVKFITF